MNGSLFQIQTSSLKIRDRLVAFQKVDKRWTKFLRGGCATASLLLHKELTKQGINSWMVHASSKSVFHGQHVWLETEHFLIDLTYSQFQKQETMIILCKHTDQVDNYYGKFFNIFPMGIDHFDIFKWPAAQDPIKCLKRMKEKMKKAITA